MNHKPIEDKWLEWFIGFTEGDGAILEYQGRLSYVISQKDVNVLYHIRDTLGFGNVKIKYDLGFGRYEVTGFDNIHKLACLFNGNLILDKRKVQLAVWVKILYSKGKTPPLKEIENNVDLTLDSA